MDHVKTAWLNACGASDHMLKSADALFVSEDTAYLVEFKNGEQGNVKKWEIENQPAPLTFKPESSPAP